MDMNRYASEWLNAEDVSKTISEPTKIKILDEGTETEGKYGKKVAFSIDVNGVERMWTPNKTAVRAIIKKLETADTLEWVGKTINLVAVDTLIRGEMKPVVVVV